MESLASVFPTGPSGCAVLDIATTGGCQSLVNELIHCERKYLDLVLTDDLGVVDVIACPPIVHQITLAC